MASDTGDFLYRFDTLILVIWGNDKIYTYE